MPRKEAEAAIAGFKRAYPAIEKLSHCLGRVDKVRNIAQRIPGDGPARLQDARGRIAGGQDRLVDGDRGEHQEPDHEERDQ